MNTHNRNPDPDQKPTLLQLVGSVLSAAVGIQSNKIESAILSTEKCVRL